MTGAVFSSALARRSRRAGVTLSTLAATPTTLSPRRSPPPLLCARARAVAARWATARAARPLGRAQRRRSWRRSPTNAPSGESLLSVTARGFSPAVGFPSSRSPLPPRIRFRRRLRARVRTRGSRVGARAFYVLVRRRPIRPSRRRRGAKAAVDAARESPPNPRACGLYRRTPRPNPRPSVFHRHRVARLGNTFETEPSSASARMTRRASVRPRGPRRKPRWDPPRKRPRGDSRVGRDAHNSLRRCRVRRASVETPTAPFAGPPSAPEKAVPSSRPPSASAPREVRPGRSEIISWLRINADVAPRVAA